MRSNILKLLFLVGLVSSCTTHRVLKFTGCGDGKVELGPVDDILSKEIYNGKFIAYGDGQDNYLELGALLFDSLIECKELKDINLRLSYNWEDVLISFIPFISQKTLVITSVTDGN